jgi:hypothetical protein
MDGVFAQNPLIRNRNGDHHTSNPQRRKIQDGTNVGAMNQIRHG